MIGYRLYYKAIRITVDFHFLIAMSMLAESEVYVYVVLWVILELRYFRSRRAPWDYKWM